MIQFLSAFAIFALAMAAMAVGVIISGKRIKGSCGGLADARDEQGNPLCNACSNPSPVCTGENKEGAIAGESPDTFDLREATLLDDSQS